MDKKSGSFIGEDLKFGDEISAYVCMNCKAEIVIKELEPNKSRKTTCPYCEQVHSIKKTKNTFAKKVLKDGIQGYYGKFKDC